MIQSIYNTLYNNYLEFKLANKLERTKIIETLRKNNIKLLKTSFQLTKMILRNEINSVEGTLTALFCIGIEGFMQDPRDSIGILSLLNRSTIEVELDLNLFIEENIRLFEEEAQLRFRNWINRERKDLEVFGFSEIYDENNKLIDYNLNGVVFNS